MGNECTGGSRSILLNPPRIIDRAQRVKYGAMAAIVEMAESAFVDLKSTAITYAQRGKEPLSDDSNLRMKALNLAWSIVDQADLLRHTIKSEGQQIQLQEANDFLKIAEPIQEVRNWMRHLPQRIEGYLKRKEALPPALGALSFAVVRRTRPGVPISGEVADADIMEFHTLVLVSASFQRGLRLEGVPEPYASFKTPVDHFYLQAFGQHLNLERIVASMSAFCDSLAMGVRRYVDQKLKELKAAGMYRAELEQPEFQPGALYTMTAKRD
jgi:hypothetical protein